MSKKSKRDAGAGGNASVEGSYSFAIGGDGGDGLNGGDGGAASVKGNYSGALGGPGGRGGRGRGMPGGDARVNADRSFAAGGQGGEAGQVDGRGGRGGRSFPFYDIGVHLKAPWCMPRQFQPGRGGDGADTIQYRARHIIIEAFKHEYYLREGVPATEEAIWYDRTAPMEWINERLIEEGHSWRVILDDWEYSFHDV